MGYCMSLHASKFVIKKANKIKTLYKIKALAKSNDKMSGGSYGPGDQRTHHFAWVNMREFAEAKTLELALDVETVTEPVQRTEVTVNQRPRTRTC